MPTTTSTPDTYTAGPYFIDWSEGGGVITARHEPTIWYVSVTEVVEMTDASVTAIHVTTMTTDRHAETTGTLVANAHGEDVLIYDGRQLTGHLADAITLATNVALGVA